jgi:Domain of unknown function (DUF4169)
MLGPTMSDVINLKKARKKVEPKLDQNRAAANRLRFGLSKSDRKLMEARNAKVCRDLDLRRVETGGER